VKRFVREPASSDVDRWLREQPAVTSRLTLVEVVSAAARRVRDGTLTAAGKRRVLAGLDADARRYTLIEIGPSVAGRARDLLLLHPLRSADAIHLASALEIQDELARRVEFVCFDRRLADAARAEGLPVLGA
jgi:uncharacterized protein